MQASHPPAALYFLGITVFGLAACGRFFLAVTTLPTKPPGSVVVSLSIRDSPPPGVTLLSAEVTLTGTDLSPNPFSLINNPVRVQLKKLETETMFLATAHVPANLFGGLSVTLANLDLKILNNSASALGGCPSGSVCEIRPALHPAAVFIPHPLVLDPNTPVGLTLDFDLNRSIRSDLSVTPSLGVTEVDALLGQGKLAEVNDFTGKVARADSSQFVIQSNSSGLALDVRLNDATVFAGFDQAGLPDNSSAVRAGQIASVDMSLLADGTLLAHRVELEGDASAELAEGVVLSVDRANNQFNLVVLDEVPDINGLAVGDEATVIVQPAAGFGLDAAGLAVPPGLTFSGPADLMPGQEVQVRILSLIATAPAIAIASDRVRLRMGQFRAVATTKNGSDFTVAGLPSLSTSTGTSEILVQTSPATEFENLLGVTDLIVGDTISLRGLLFRATPSPALLARKVRKR